MSAGLNVLGLACDCCCPAQDVIFLPSCTTFRGLVYIRGSRFINVIIALHVLPSHHWNFSSFWSDIFLYNFNALRTVLLTVVFSLESLSYFCMHLIFELDHIPL